MSMAKEKEKIDNPFVTTGYAGAEYFHSVAEVLRSVITIGQKWILHYLTLF